MCALGSSTGSVGDFLRTKLTRRTQTKNYKISMRMTMREDKNHIYHPKHLAIFFIVFAALSGSCTKTGKNQDNKAVQSHDMRYTRQAAMNIYGYHPERALQIIDSAVVVGNISKVGADITKARIYSYSLMPDVLDSLLGGPEGVHLDTARAMGERLLEHDSVKADLGYQFDILEVLVYTARMQNDTIGWMKRSRELVDICNKLGPEAETDALRTESEVGAALHCLGKHKQGIEKIDSAINLLEASFLQEENRGTFDELDALIISLKRKISMFAAHGQYAETLPLARRIIELLDEYEKHPDAFHDDSKREPANEAKRADYINFYRSQAQNFITAAYSALGEQGNMIDAFGKIEQGVRDITAREHIARYNAMQQQMTAELQRAKAHRTTQIAVALGILAALFLITAIIAIIENRAISRKNRILAHKISDAINYKKMYIEEKRAQAPLATPDAETATDEQLFQHISDIIVRERLFLDPKFERQTIMDRFQLTKERVGAIFSRGSDYSKLTNYIQQLRLEYAAKLLVEQPDKSVVQIAAECGFSSNTYFSNCFRQHYGISPTDFRRGALSKRDDNMDF